MATEMALLHSQAASIAWDRALRAALQRQRMASEQVIAATDVALATHPDIVRYNAAIIAGERPANVPIKDWPGDVPVPAKTKTAGVAAIAKIRTICATALNAIAAAKCAELAPAEAALAADRDARLANPGILIFGA